MIGGAVVRGKVGAVWDVDVVPKLIWANQGQGCWSIVPIDPRIVTGGGGDGSDLAAHIESPDKLGELGVCAG